MSTQESLEDFKEKVKRQTDLAEVIGEHSKLVRSSNGYKCCCPLPGHKEKTPSFNINTKEDFFYCYGCQRGGDVFTFLNLVDGLSFIEALKELAAKLNLELPKSDGFKSKSPAKTQAIQKTFELLKRSAGFYANTLLNSNSSESLRAREYLLKKRELTDEDVIKFELGLAPKKPKELFEKTRTIFSQEVLDKSGLFRISKHGSYDFFSNRVMIPIHDAKGRVVAFSGRSLEPVTSTNPKYKNSPEGDFFKKKELLYGLHFSSRLMRDKNYVCVVEGFFDQWALFKKEIPCVAVMGTALTFQHAKLIKKHAKEVVLFLDADTAGVNSTIRAIPMLIQEGLEVKVFQLQQGLKDPDEWLATQQNVENKIIEAQIHSAKEALFWWAEHTITESKKNSLNNVQIINRLGTVFESCTSVAHKSMLAEKVSIVMGLKKNELISSLSKSSQAQPYKNNPPPNLDESEEAYTPPQHTKTLTDLDKASKAPFIFFCSYIESLSPETDQEWEKLLDIFDETICYEPMKNLFGYWKKNNHSFDKIKLENISEDTLIKTWSYQGIVEKAQSDSSHTKRDILKSFDGLCSQQVRLKINAKTKKLMLQLGENKQNPEKSAQLLQEIQGLRLSLEKH